MKKPIHYWAVLLKQCILYRVIQYKLYSLYSFGAILQQFWSCWYNYIRHYQFIWEQFDSFVHLLMHQHGYQEITDSYHTPGILFFLPFTCLLSKQSCIQMVCESADIRKNPLTLYQAQPQASFFSKGLLDSMLSQSDQFSIQLFSMSQDF